MGMPPVPEPALPDPVGGPVESSRRDAPALRGAGRKGPKRLPRRAAAGRRSFTATLRSLDELAASGAKVSVRIDDLDGGSTEVLAGDDFVTLPVGGLGVVPLLIEAAAANLQGADVTATDEEIDGTPVRCYTIDRPEGASALCVTEDGIPMALSTQGQELRATTVDDQVPADVFEPPVEAAEP